MTSFVLIEISEQSSATNSLYTYGPIFQPTTLENVVLNDVFYFSVSVSSDQLNNLTKTPNLAHQFFCHLLCRAMFVLVWRVYPLKPMQVDLHFLSNKRMCEGVYPNRMLLISMEERRATLRPVAKVVAFSSSVSGCIWFDNLMTLFPIVS